MKKIHTITTSLKTYQQIAAIVFITTILSTLIPYYGDEFQLFLTNQLVNMSILYAVIVGFLMSLMLDRTQSLEEQISIERNKIRRLFHLSYYLMQAEPKLAGWFSGVKKSIETYLRLFSNIGISNHEEGNATFRALTTTVYSLPSLTSRIIQSCTIPY